jgi:hypothetical protein
MMRDPEMGACFCRGLMPTLLLARFMGLKPALKDAVVRMFESLAPNLGGGLPLLCRFIIGNSSTDALRIAHTSADSGPHAAEH